MKNTINSAAGNLAKILIGVLLAIIITFFCQNWTVLNETALKFIGPAEYPLWFWLLLTFVAGGVAWYIVGFKTRRKLKRSLNQKEKELTDLKGELDQLRNRSLVDDTKTQGPALNSQDISDKKE